MRIALLSDIHGNDLALDAVLKDIDSQGGVDAYWVLGDLAAIGHAPVRVLERLSGLPDARFARGNTERYISTGELPGPTPDEARADPSLVNQLVEVTGDFSWTQGAITASGWLDWLTGLPLEFRAELPNGTRVLGVHASPGRDSGSGIYPGQPEAEICALLSGCQEDLVCVGHTHQPFDLVVCGRRVVNPGSVSNPVGGDVRASYALIEAGEGEYMVGFRRVAYDTGEVIRILEQIRHPARRFIIRHLEGRRV